MVAQINWIKTSVRLLLVIFCLSFGIKAQAQLPSLLTDDETETFLQNIVKPIFKVAGISFNPNKIHLLNDMSLNAFVSDGNNLFVHTGTLITAETANELSGILAHESGHISGGHIMRQKLKIQDLQTLSVVSLIAAGATAVASGRGDAAMAVALGSHGSLLNSLTAYQMQEERSADESAVRYLKALGQSPQGLRNFMKTIQKTNRLSGHKEIPYFRTHPMSAERLSFFESAIKKNGGQTSSVYDKDFQFVKAKLTAFLLPIERVLQKYRSSDSSDASKYAHAIIKFRQKRYAEAIQLIDDLIVKFPQNPYFYQLKGQFLFESGKIEQALTAYEKSLSLKPDSIETMLLYAECALESKNRKSNLQHIINTLNKIQLKRENASAWQLLSRAYFEQGKTAESFYALAKYSLFMDNIETAKLQIKKAKEMKPSSTLELKLKDLEKQIKQMEEI